MTTRVNSLNTIDSVPRAIQEQERLVLQYLLQSSDLKLLVAGVKHQLEEERLDTLPLNLSTLDTEQELQ